MGDGYLNGVAIRPQDITWNPATINGADITESDEIDMPTPSGTISTGVIANTISVTINNKKYTIQSGTPGQVYKYNQPRRGGPQYQIMFNKHDLTLCGQGGCATQGGGKRKTKGKRKNKNKSKRKGKGKGKRSTR